MSLLQKYETAINQCSEKMLENEAVDFIQFESMHWDLLRGILKRKRDVNQAVVQRLDKMLRQYISCRKDSTRNELQQLRNVLLHFDDIQRFKIFVLSA